MNRLQLELGRVRDPFKIAYLHRKLTFSFDNRYMAMTGRQEDEDAFVWELPKGKLACRPRLLGNNFLKFIGNTYNLMGDNAQIWNVKNDRVVSPPGGFEPESGVRWLLDSYFDQGAALNPAGTLLLGAPLLDQNYFYARLGMWEVETGVFKQRFETPPVKYNNSKVRFSPDGKYFILAAQLFPEDTGLEVASWNVASGAKVSEVRLEIGIDDFSFEFSPDGKMLTVNDLCYILGPNGKPLEPAHVFKPMDGELPGHSRLTLANNEMMVGRQPGEVAIYDIPTGKLKQTLEATYLGKGQEIISLEKMQPRVMGGSNDARYYAAGDDNMVLVWDTTTK